MKSQWGDAVKTVKAELYNDNFQNYKRYNIPKAQLVIADIPYNLGVNAYASSTEWYIDGDNRNGESKKAGKSFFLTDTNFNIAEYMHFCNRLLKKEPKEKGKAPAMLVFCSFQQIPVVIQYGEKYGFQHHIPLVFIKNYSAQVLKTVHNPYARSHWLEPYSDGVFLEKRFNDNLSSKGGG